MTHRRDRPDLLTRNLQEKAHAALNEQPPVPDDPRLEAIRAKAIAYLDETNPNEWTAQMWAFLKEECRKKTATPHPGETLSSMNSVDLKKFLNGASSNSPS